MNFLAHCLIGARAGPHPDLVAGGFLGDFVKGRIPEDMPEELARGVRLHRRVDAYSNSHPGIRASCRRFPPELRRISPILVDILCDHLLARRWEAFHAATLTEFSSGAYALVGARDAWLSEPGRRFLAYAREEDLFARYDDWEVIRGALRSVTRRLARGELNGIMETALPPLLESLETDFLAWFPDIIEHAADWIEADHRS